MTLTSESAQELAMFLGGHGIVLLLVLLAFVGLATLLLMLLVQMMTRAAQLSVAQPANPGYLALYLLTGVGGTLAVVLLVALGRQTAGETVINSVDAALARSLYASTTPAGRDVFAWITFFGSMPAEALLAVLVGLFLGLRRQTTLLVGWAFCLLGVELLVPMLKTLFHRPRPTVGSITYASGWSFPSGHALSSIVASGMLAYLLIRLMPKAPKMTLTGAAILWTALVGFSRMYLGVHYLSDVVAGYLAGTIWLATCISVLEIKRGRVELSGP